MDKELVGLAGEYAVASELCRLGLYCQLTLGNRKKTDLLVDSGENLFRVSVKSKQKNTWPSVKGIWQTGDLLVFVDYKDKQIGTPPDFYVVDVSTWKKVLENKIKELEDPRIRIDDKNTMYWPGEEGEKNAWTGCSISISDIEDYKDNWSVITTQPA